MAMLASKVLRKLDNGTPPPARGRPGTEATRLQVLLPVLGRGPDPGRATPPRPRSGTSLRSTGSAVSCTSS
jgi:hypothetical protein